jgi:hypothetical protein
VDAPSARPPGREEPHAPRFEAVPKPSGGIRWLTRLDPADRARYELAVRPLVGRIERSLGPEVFATRGRRTSSGWRVAPWRPARRAWRRAVRAALAGAGRGTSFAVADVRDCYGSISAETLEDLLGSEAAHAVAVLRTFRERGVRGLPVGPDPSAFLANVALAELDVALRRAGVRHVRWVDDVFAWGDATQVRRAVDGLGRAAASLGWELHAGKTMLVADREEAHAVALGARDSSIIAAP